MKIELYKAYKTRGGRKVVVVEKTSDGFFNTWIKGEDEILSIYENGCLWRDGSVSKHDLIAPWEELKTGEMWVNIYVNHATCFDTKEEALAMAGVGFIACKRVQWTEGDKE